jgi:hypothetical protein
LGDLSTMCRNRGGQRWITLKRLGFAQRSRWANSLRRSALSLMKPCASFWS